MSADVSVVINTFNRCATLKNTLRAMHSLTYPNFEVVVVNGPSNDGTADLLAGYSDKLKILDCAAHNLSISRNIGIAGSSGDIVAFIDDDAIPHPTWLDNLLVDYKDPSVAGVGGFTIDNTGVHFQATKTICDRYGRAFSVSNFFDERPLNFPGTPFYPSLLGTNSSFRRESLIAIGGFDEAYAYFLDETDVCLRLVDAGFKIVYSPEAIVYHQYAESAIRTSRRVHKSLYTTVRSKAYFVIRHGAVASLSEAANVIEEYEKELLQSNIWHSQNNIIDTQHKASLDRDVITGLNDGKALALSGRPVMGSLAKESSRASLKPFPSEQKLCIALISRSYPPHRDSGIPRWTQLLAIGLAERGNDVHVITETEGAYSSQFNDGVWTHHISSKASADAGSPVGPDIPSGLLSWSLAVKRQLQKLKRFRIQVISAPIWDLEGIALLGELPIPVFTSLHTTYAISKPFKIEWNNRPLFEHFHVNKVIEHERSLFSQSPFLLANSQSIVHDLEASYGLSPSGSVYRAVHGTPDPLRSRMRSERRGALRIAFVGRFEPRKGFDIAAAAVSQVVMASENVEVTFSGDVLSNYHKSILGGLGALDLLTHSNVNFHGHLTRTELDDLYARTDVVLMTSRYESFGLVAIEAMAAGCAVIALNIGGLKEVITHGSDGFLIEIDGHEVEKCAETLSLLSRDELLCTSLSKNARKAFEEKFTVDTMCAAVEEAFKSALSLWDRDDSTYDFNTRGSEGL